MLDKAYDLKKNGDKVKAEKWQESWKKETAMPEHGSLLRKTETPQTNSKNQQEKPRPQIMQGLETDAATSTERPLEKTDSETKNTTQDYTPIIESKDKGTLAREL